MSLLIKNARLIDPESGTDDIGSVLIEDGVISTVGAERGETEIDAGGKCLAPGIVDLGVTICEPGERHKESFRIGQAPGEDFGVRNDMVAIRKCYRTGIF